MDHMIGSQHRCLFKFPGVSKDGSCSEFFPLLLPDSQNDGWTDSPQELSIPVISSKRPLSKADLGASINVMPRSILKRSRDDSQRKRSLQAPLKTPPNLNISLPESLPMQRSTVEDSSMQQDQEFVTRDNDEQPANKETWMSQVARAEEPPTSFDELNDTSFDFSAFVMNRLKIPNLTQEILVGPAFNLLKGTCKSITELEYHLEECSKATTEQLD
ncbi:hypothetical protein Tco_0137803 [Tanacetum coccineum]